MFNTGWNILKNIVVVQVSALNRTKGCSIKTCGTVILNKNFISEQTIQGSHCLFRERLFRYLKMSIWYYSIRDRIRLNIIRYFFQVWKINKSIHCYAAYLDVLFSIVNPNPFVPKQSNVIFVRTIAVSWTEETIRPQNFSKHFISFERSHNRIMFEKLFRGYDHRRYTDYAVDISLFQPYLRWNLAVWPPEWPKSPM